MPELYVRVNLKQPGSQEGTQSYFTKYGIFYDRPIIIIIQDMTEHSAKTIIKLVTYSLSRLPYSIRSK